MKFNQTICMHKVSDLSSKAQAFPQKNVMCDHGLSPCRKRLPRVKHHFAYLMPLAVRSYGKGHTTLWQGAYDRIARGVRQKKNAFPTVHRKIRGRKINAPPLHVPHSAP